MNSDSEPSGRPRSSTSENWAWVYRLCLAGAIGAFGYFWERADLKQDRLIEGFAVQTQQIELLRQEVRVNAASGKEANDRMSTMLIDHERRLRLLEFDQVRRGGSPQP